MKTNEDEEIIEISPKKKNIGRTRMASPNIASGDVYSELKKHATSTANRKNSGHTNQANGGRGTSTIGKANIKTLHRSTTLRNSSTIKGKPVVKKKMSTLRKAGIAAVAIFGISFGSYFVDAIANDRDNLNVDARDIPTTLGTGRNVLDEQEVGKKSIDLTFEDMSEDKESDLDEKYSNISDHVYIQNYGGKNYYYCDEDYVVYLSHKALENVRTTIETIKPDSDFLKVLNAGYIDESLLTGTAFTESGYRYVDENGNILYNGVAYGMTQGTPDTMETINNVFGKYGFEFNKKTLKDPQVAMEFSTCVYLFNAYYHASNIMDIYNPANRNNMRVYLSDSYFWGGGGAIKRYSDGRAFSDDYSNKVLSKAQTIESKYFADYSMGD